MGMMGESKLLTLLYKHANEDGSTSPISGASASCAVIRISDGYKWDEVAQDFNDTDPDPKTMEESGVVEGLYTVTFDPLGWQDDTYLFNPEATLEGEMPFGYVETITISSGVISSTTNVDPAPTGFCVAYLFFNDKPATCPTTTAKYLSGNSNANVMVPISATGTYDDVTGFLYFTLLQGATVEFKCLDRGLHNTAIIPAISTESILSLPEVF